MGDQGSDEGTRWAARPALARVLRVAVFASPVVATVGVSSLAHLALGAAGSRVEQAWHLAVLIAVSTVTLVAVDRAMRRALPLATLLDLSMLFPDHAPSRLAVAREAVRKRPIEDQLARVRDAGADPAVAAREILGLVAAMRNHDRATRGHAERVRMLTDLVAEAMNVPARDRDLLRWAAILHDIGKLRVPPAILNKPGKPTDQEWALLRAHPMHGAQIAGALLPWLGEWGDVIVQHHEKYDGTGYPAGLAGREISLGGRIVAAADAYEVMTAARAYRRPVSRVAAHRELVKWSGRQFDPAVVRAMVGLSAPRLRRAQGLLAWLCDIPMVATGYGPAATVARVVGAGALATGAATGVVGPVVAGPVVAGPVPVVAAASSWNASAPASASSVEGRTAPSGSTATTVGAGVSSPSSQASPLAGNKAPMPARVTKAPPAPVAGGATPVTKIPTPRKSPDPTSDNDGSANSGSGNSGSGSGGSGNSGPDPVATAVTDVTGTVGDVTVTVGDVTGTVGDVTDVVTDVVTGVVDVAGGLLGGGHHHRH